MIVDTSYDIRQAVKLRALKLSRPNKEITYSEVVNAILEGRMPPLVDEIAEAAERTGDDPQPKRRKPPTKPGA